jgi:hypothetical protein
MKAHVPHIGIGWIVSTLLAQTVVGLVQHRHECLHGWMGVALTRHGPALDWAAPEQTLFNDGLGSTAVIAACR